MSGEQATRNKAGWRVLEWSDEAGCKKSKTNELIKEKRIKSVKLDGARIILTPPREFLESLAEQQADKAA